jgi:hypothetical protein
MKDDASFQTDTAEKRINRSAPSSAAPAGRRRSRHLVRAGDRYVDDEGKQLDALAKLDQKALVERAQAGEKINVTQAASRCRPTLSVDAGQAQENGPTGVSRGAKDYAMPALAGESEPNRDGTGCP